MCDVDKFGSLEVYRTICDNDRFGSLEVCNIVNGLISLQVWNLTKLCLYAMMIRLEVGSLHNVRDADKSGIL